jgi:hypothetical protein
MKFSVYATFEEMHGYKSSLDELVAKLKPFSRESVVYGCAAVGMVLRLWQGVDWDRASYDLVIAATFDSLRADWYRLSARTDNPELAVHRRQLLLIMKLAIEHCGPQGLDLLAAPPGYFGTILLMANDHLHFGLYPFAAQASADEREKVLRVLAEFVPITEYAESRIENRIVRSHLMMTKFTDRLEGHPDHINVGKVFRELTSISLDEHEALTFGLFSRCNIVTLESLKEKPLMAAVREMTFYKTAVPRKTISAFFSEFAATPAELKLQIESARERNRDHGANDLTVFRRKPLVIEQCGMIPVDMVLTIEKFQTGPYWRVNNINRETGDRLRRFWGAVFEAYVNDHLDAATSYVGALFVPDPRWASDPAAQVCDGALIEGEALVLLEYKSSMFTARAKYSGDHVLLRDEIVTKLVRNEDTAKRKGVEQLAEAVRRMLKGGPESAVKGLDLTQIKHIYPMLITLDNVGGTLLMSRLLNGYFKEFLADQLIPAEKVHPLLCTDVESLEIVLPLLDVFPLSRFLQHWLDSDPTLMATLQAHLPNGLPNRRNEILYGEWRRISEQMQSLLFPEEHAANRQATAPVF